MGLGLIDEPIAETTATIYRICSGSGTDWLSRITAEFCNHPAGMRADDLLVIALILANRAARTDMLAGLAPEFWYVNSSQFQELPGSVQRHFTPVQFARAT